MPKPLLRRSGLAALALTGFAALVIGCGGGGGGGGSSSNTSGTGSTSSGSTTSGSTTSGSTTANPTTTSSSATTGAAGGGGTATSPGALPQNSIFYAVTTAAGTYDVKYVKEDGTTGGTYAADQTFGTPVPSPDPSLAGRYVFAAVPSGSSNLGIYRSMSGTITGANTVVSARYGEIDGLDVARDGSRVVYIAATSAGGTLGLYTVSTASGSSPSMIGAAYDASLDADGLNVVYAADGSGGTDVYARNLATGAVTSITTTTGTDEDEPQYSKQGDKIVFSETVNGGTPAYRLATYTAATGTVTPLNPFPNDAGVVLRAPSFNGAGTRISFVAIDTVAGVNSGLYTCDLTGANVTQVVASGSLLPSTFWTTAQGRALGGLPFHFASPRRLVVRP